MAVQRDKFSFKRYEKKYFLTPDKANLLLNYMMPYMKQDEYGKYTICNIYYDTDSFGLIRNSIEKPVYKEKLRVRSYGTPANDSKVFIEIKKKYDGVVYKRRITTRADQVEAYLNGYVEDEKNAQIRKEILYFQNMYRSKPKVFIGYDRLAFAGIEDPELRITFDTNLRYRANYLDLRYGDKGLPIINDDRVLMEIKIPGTCPLWLSHLLDGLEIRPISFSKYGTCYKNYILPYTIGAYSKQNSYVAAGVSKEAYAYV
ncbi:MAG: polyphosphate polymerase domain-containing protein [Lachnospiraceae bacterium]|nr:polyphosphate polymerase domain-containing protein [Lachnospiraceae bacterium]